MKDEQLKKWTKRAAAIGVLLGFICPLLPAEYQTACNTIASICTAGGL